jgi:hypothetical protein
MRKSMIAAAVVAVGMAFSVTPLAAPVANAAPDCNANDGSGNTSGEHALCNTACQLDGSCAEAATPGAMDPTTDGPCTVGEANLRCSVSDPPAVDGQNPNKLCGTGSTGCVVPNKP